MLPGLLGNNTTNAPIRETKVGSTVSRNMDSMTVRGLPAVKVELIIGCEEDLISSLKCSFHFIDCLGWKFGFLGLMAEEVLDLLELHGRDGCSLAIDFHGVVCKHH